MKENVSGFNHILQFVIKYAILLERKKIDIFVNNRCSFSPLDQQL